MVNNKRVLICGSRDYTNCSFIKSVLINLRQNGFGVVIEGEARGADTLARNAALSLGMRVVRFPANWKRYGKAAGPIRNKQMLVEGKPELVVAFYSNRLKSTGTSNMVSQAISNKVRTIEYEGTKLV